MQQPTLEVLEESILNKSIDIPKADNQDNRNDIFISGSESSDTDSLYKLSTPSIPENMTFDRFKALLVQINPYYPQSAITLDLPLSSVIRTPKEKEQFRKKVKQNFHLSETQINYLMKENKLIWDWINLLR